MVLMQRPETQCIAATVGTTAAVTAVPRIAAGETRKTGAILTPVSDSSANRVPDSQGGPPRRWSGRLGMRVLTGVRLG